MNSKVCRVQSEKISIYLAFMTNKETRVIAKKYLIRLRKVLSPLFKLLVLNHAGGLSCVTTLLLLFILFLLYECAQDSYFRILVCLEVKCILLAEAKLQQVVIKGFLGNVHFQSSVLQGEAH